MLNLIALIRVCSATSLLGIATTIPNELFINMYHSFVILLTFRNIMQDYVYILYALQCI